MKNIKIDLKSLEGIKDEVFGRLVEEHAADAIDCVLKEEVARNLFRCGDIPQVLTEVDAKGYAWVGNENIRVLVHLEQFNKDVATEIAENI